MCIRDRPDACQGIVTLSHCRAGDCERRWRRLPRQGIDGGLDSMGAPECEPRPLPVPAAAQWRTRVVRNTSVSKPAAILTAPTMAVDDGKCRLTADFECSVPSRDWHGSCSMALEKGGKDHEPHPLGRRAGPSVRGRRLLLEQQTRVKVGGAFTSLTGCSITGLRKEGWHHNDRIRGSDREAGAKEHLLPAGPFHRQALSTRRDVP